MRKLLLVAGVTLYCTVAYSQGINFEKGLSWREILQKAKTENKYILVDCYATWCGPCKLMERNIFTDTAVSNYYNANFIAVRLQLDTSNKDDDNIKANYRLAKSFATRFSVSAYPTFLFFSPDGNVINRFEGYTDNPNEFISKGKQSTSYLQSFTKYLDGDRSDAILEQLSNQAMSIGDSRSARLIFSEWYNKTRDQLSQDNLLFIWWHTLKSTDIAFPLFRFQQAKVDSVMGAGNAMQKINYIVYMEEIDPILKANSSNPDWKKIKYNVAVKYPELGEKFVLFHQLTFYMQHKKIAEAGKLMPYYVSRYIDPSRPGAEDELNRYAFWVFSNSKNNRLLKRALKWAYESVAIAARGYNLDTYASLLYTLGRKQEGILWQRKAVAADPQDTRLTATLNKMEQGLQLN